MIETKLKATYDSLVEEIAEITKKMADHKNISVIDYCEALAKRNLLEAKRDSIELELVKLGM